MCRDRGRGPIKVRVELDRRLGICNRYASLGHSNDIVRQVDVECAVKRMRNRPDLGHRVQVQPIQQYAALSGETMIPLNVGGA